MCSIAPCGVNWEQDYMSFKGKHCLKQLAQWPHFCWYTRQSSHWLVEVVWWVACTPTLRLCCWSCKAAKPVGGTETWHCSACENVLHIILSGSGCASNETDVTRSVCSTGDNVAFVHTTSAILEGTALLLNCIALSWEALRQCHSTEASRSSL